MKGKNMKLRGFFKWNLTPKRINPKYKQSFHRNFKKIGQ